MKETAVPQAGKDKQVRSQVRLEFGRKILQADQHDKLAAGAVIELDAFADDYVDVYADRRLIARGRAVVIDGKLAVRVQESLTGQLPS